MKVNLKMENCMESSGKFFMDIIALQQIILLLVTTRMVDFLKKLKDGVLMICDFKYQNFIKDCCYKGSLLIDI